MIAFLPYGRQSINEADIAAVVDVLRSDFLTTGPMVDKFEADLAKTVGAQEAVVVSNGTAALHLAVMTQNLGPKDVVIVPSITFAATANAVAYCGAQVVFADVDPHTGLISDAGFDNALNLIKRDLPGYRFAGVIPVHYAGRPVNLKPMAPVCSEYGAFLIEDACHAIGTTGPQGMAGSCMASDMACFSFHPVKTMTTGEGGAITLNDPAVARRLRNLRSHGIERDPAHFIGLGYAEDSARRLARNGPWLYEMQELGFNYRLPDINCALGISQLMRLGVFRDRRALLVSEYHRALSALTAATNLPVTWMPPGLNEHPVFHLFAVNIDFKAIGLTRSQVMQGLKNRGIGSQVHYIPVHRMPFWRKRALLSRNLPNADAFYQNTLSLPLYADMNDDDPRRVIEALQAVLMI